MAVGVHLGDMLAWLAAYDGPLFDAAVTDPPYHLTSIVKRFGGDNAAPAKAKQTGAYARASRGFMGKQWDGGDIAFRPETWRAVYDALKPGALLAAFGGTRTFHRLACAIEDAGFEIRDTLSWNYASGFPKSHNISNALAALPTCSCDVSSNRPAIIDTIAPPCSLRAGVGTELVSVLSARGAADAAGGLRLQAPMETNGREPVVQSGIEGFDGHLDPIVFGPLNVTGIAEGEQVALGVGSGEVDPEALRDEMVGDQSLGCAAINAAAVAGDDSGGDAGPSASLVSPPLSAPSRVAAALHPGGVVSGHAGSGTVSSGPAPNETVGLELGGAGFALEDRHTAERSTTGFKCEVCGGVIRNEIPQGLGTALKPAMELICLARKPLSEKTVAANVLKWGTGALNIDGCRVGDFVNMTPPGTERYNAANHRQGYRPNDYGRDGEASADRRYGSQGSTNFNPLPGHRGGAPEGRWPANLIHDGSDEVLGAFPDAAGQQGVVTGNEPSSPFANVYGDMPNRAGSAVPRGDEGSAARFFYSAKAGPLDRIGTKHATVKPVDLMRWLNRLVTPPGGHILDPFAGSGTTGIAAMAEGFDCTMIELEADHFADIERKLAFLRGEGAVTLIEHNRHRPERDGGDLPLFAA